MHNYYKYLPIGSQDERWGLHVLNTGYLSFGKSEAYPQRNHPSHHYFNWNNGRILNEYQLIYISKGEGIFESSSCKKTIVPEGSAILLFPNEWHRYKPNKDTGWDEFWVGFKGFIMDKMVVSKFFTPKEPVMQIGIQEKVVNLITEIIENTKDEKAGYQTLISGIVVHLLGYLNSINKLKTFDNEESTRIVVEKAIIKFRTNIESNISIEDVCAELQVSYSWFRKSFKKYTGISPWQYFLQLKIEKAKSLLSNPLLSIKEIAFELNFESAFYFSKLFKQKTGVSPKHFRKSFLLKP